MNHKIKGTKPQKQKRKEMTMTTGLFACLIVLLFRIPLGYIIGDQGVGYFAAGMEIFILFTCMIAYSFSKSTAVLVKYRVRREMYKSIKKVYRNALLLAGILGLLAGASMLVFSEWIARNIIMLPLGYLSIAAAAPGIFLISLIGIWRGYFQGMGSMIPSVHSKFIEKIIMAASGLLMGFIFYSYGKKVAGLLKSENYAYAYGGFGAALGILIACIFCALHLLLIYSAYSGTRKRLLQKDNIKAAESSGQIIGMLVTTALPYGALAILYNINPLVDMGLFFYAMKVRAVSGLGVVQWGIYYGKYLAIAGGIAVVCTIVAVGRIPKIMQAYEHKDLREVQAGIKLAVHQLAMLTIPVAVILAVTAESLTGMLFSKEVKMTSGLLQAGAPLVVLFPFTYFFTTLLLRAKKISIVLIGGLIAFLAHGVLTLMLLLNTNLNVTAVALGGILFYLTASGAGLLGITKHMQYTQEWLKTFGVTGIAAGATGLIGLLIHKALYSFAGDIITFLITLIICVVLYLVLLLILKGVTKEELEQSPGGRILADIGEKLRLI